MTEAPYGLLTLRTFDRGQHMSPITNNYTAQADNMKRALRNAAKRWQEAGKEGRKVTVHNIGLVSVAPPRSGLIEQTEEAVDLNVDGVVFLPDLVQFGIPCSDTEADYYPMNANEFVAWLTQAVSDDDEAFDILEPYYRAVMNLP